MSSQLFPTDQSVWYRHNFFSSSHRNKWWREGETKPYICFGKTEFLIVTPCIEGNNSGVLVAIAFLMILHHVLFISHHKCLLYFEATSLA